MKPDELRPLLDDLADGPTRATFDAIYRRAGRRRRALSAIAIASIVALVAIAIAVPVLWSAGGTNGSSSPLRPAPSQPTPSTPKGWADPLHLVNRWAVLAPNAHGVTMVLGRGMHLIAPCGSLEGGWRADRFGDFVAMVVGGSEGCFRPSGEVEPMQWLTDAVGFEVEGSAAVLLNASGQTVARLVPLRSRKGRPHPTRNNAILRQLATPAALPNDLAPASPASILGWWRPLEPNVSARAFLSFGDDGLATGTDGCNGAGGRYEVGPGGLLLHVSGLFGDVGCAISQYVDAFNDAGRAGIDSAGQLVLTDGTGQVIGRFARVPTGRVSGRFAIEPGGYGGAGSLSGSILVTPAGAAEPLTTATVSGSFAFDLPPGRYGLTGNSPHFRVDGAEATCSAAHDVTIRAGHSTTVDVVCQAK